MSGDRGERTLPTLRCPIADDELIVGNSGQCTQLTTCSLEGTGLRPGEYFRRDPTAGLDAGFGSGITDGADYVDQRSEVIFGKLVSASTSGQEAIITLSPACGSLPEGLGDKRHERMEKADRALHRIGQCLRDGFTLCRRITLADPRRLDIPVAELRPDQLRIVFPASPY